MTQPPWLKGGINPWDGDARREPDTFDAIARLCGDAEYHEAPRAPKPTSGLIEQQRAADLQAVCTAHRWRFCFIGGLSVLRWGEPRETVDVHLTLVTGFGQEAEFVSILTQAFGARIDDAAEFALVKEEPDLMERLERTRRDSER